MPFSTTPQCLITGCDILFDRSRQHGDLWELGNCYIFNAVGEPGPANTFYVSPHLLMIQNGGQNHFVRHNIYVVEKSVATLNTSAIKHILRGAPL